MKIRRLIQGLSSKQPPSRSTPDGASADSLTFPETNPSLNVIETTHKSAEWRSFAMSSASSDAQETQNAESKEGEDPETVLPSPDEVLPSIRIYSHSTLFYWWPIWLVGFIFAGITYFKGGVIDVDQVRREWFHPSSALGLSYIMLLMLVITFTNLTVRGIYSVTLLLGIAFLIVLFAWIGWWDDILEFVPLLSVHMNMGFYLVFSTLVFALWMLTFFVFDRLEFWRVRPGQLTREKLIGGAEETYDTRGMLVEEFSDDYFRHYLLGIGTGDISLQTAGAKNNKIYIPNVLFADAKVDSIQRLVAVEPNKLMPDPE